MPDPFFVASKGQKRKRAPAASSSSAASERATKKQKHGQPSKPSKSAVKPAQTSRKRRDEESESEEGEDDGNIDDLDLTRSDEDQGASGDEDAHETPAEKRLRLAKLYLESVKKDMAEGDIDAAEVDKEILSARLRQDVQEQSGKLSIFIADQVNISSMSSRTMRGHKLAITAAVASEDGAVLFTSSKDGTIVKWDLQTGKEVKRFPKLRSDSKGKGKARAEHALDGHTDQVLALALSSDGKFLASGGRDRKLCIWDAQAATFVRAFTGHRDAVSALAFRKGANVHHLFSASFDRTIRMYDLGAMGLVETLFGHQDRIQHVDALRAETAVSVGGRDRTARFWKVADESQLVFRGGRATAQEILANGMDQDKDEKETASFVEGTLDCVAMVDDTTFVTGGDSGSICLWTTAKKKPVFTLSTAHGIEEHPSETEGIVLEPRWITALACLRFSDVVASGSSDGFVRLWKVDSKLRNLSSIGSIAAPGVINSLQIISPKPFFTNTRWAESAAEAAAAAGKSQAVHGVRGVCVVAAVGQEPRFGRWLRLRGEGMSNRTMVLAMPLGVAK
ncbi:WD40 repeat-like protein [Auriculariales sp. MPI-PUGE-AT-0066]|nr:WD40 repeat-like protein [Auriculariales sp. MPI-PUGE-AT-0066]